MAEVLGIPNLLMMWGANMEDSKAKIYPGAAYEYLHPAVPGVRYT